MKQNTLAAILIVQLLVVVAIWIFGRGGANEPEAFLDFDISLADRVTVASQEESIELTREDESWRLADGNPVDQRKLDRVLERLGTAGGDWPVATSDNTAKRFEVTEESFQKHVSIYAGEESLADVYLGTSPSFRRVHARKASGGPVYAIEFSNHEAGTTPVSWLDKTLLRSEGSIAKLERVGAYTLTNQEEAWVADPESELDESKVRSFIDRFETISVFEFSDDDISDVEPTAEFVIEDDEGPTTLTIYHLELTDDWVATSDRHPSQYALATYVGKELLKEIGELAPDVEENESQETNDGSIIVTTDEEPEVSD